MAKANVALGAVLGTVTDTANTISGAVNTISNSLSMLNNYVAHQQKKQVISQKVDLHSYKTRLLEDTSIEEAKRKEEIALICSNATTATYYNDAYTQLQTLLG